MCSARADIKQQVDELKSTTISTASLDGVQSNLQAIGKSVSQMVEAQKDLKGDRKKDVQDATQTYVPISSTVVDGAKLPVFWGDADLQGLHVGFFVAIAALVVYWLILDRTTLGYGVKAVGFNPEAARYGGINVSRNYFLAMAISGAFVGEEEHASVLQSR